MPTLPQEWKDELDKLRAERDAARADSAAVRKSIDQLARMMAKNNERLDQIYAMLRRREAQLKRAQAENRKLRRKLGIGDPDDDPEPDPVGGLSSGSSESSGAEPNSSSGSGGGEPSTRPKRKRRGRSQGGRRAPPEHLPADTEHHRVCACGHCGGRVLKKDVQTSIHYDVVPSYIRRRIIHRERVVCAECNRPTTAAIPPMPCKRALYTSGFLAWLVMMKFGMLIPLDRVRLLLQSQGVNIAMGTLFHLIARAADLAAAIDGEHMKQLKRGPMMGFDGTGLKVLVEGQTKAWDAYLEVYTRDEISVFQFDMTKHADRLRERLRGFSGILLCDAESRNAAGSPGVRHANCNAHPMRRFKDAIRVQPKLAAQGARFLRALYDLEAEARSRDLVGESLLVFRQRHSRRVVRRFKQWLVGVDRLALPPSDPLGGVVRYYLRHFEALTRFVDDPDLPMDNNVSEREFQRHAKLRYASLFAGSPEGAHRWAVLLGIVRTAQKCGLDVQAYLTWLFDHRGTYRRLHGKRACELTPMAYRDTVFATASAA